jgi:hypothetical protein
MVKSAFPKNFLPVKDEQVELTAPKTDAMMKAPNEMTNGYCPLGAIPKDWLEILRIIIEENKAA